MVGIKSFGGYIPKLRLSREMVAQGWGIPGAPGTVAVANFDEDSLTMAYEAAADCMVGLEPEKLGGVFFASTTSPYAEKSSATLIATVLDAPQDIYTADFATSLRASPAALGAALDAASAGKADNIVVTAAETRVAEPKTTWEQTLGDGAGAVLIGEGDDVVAEYLGSISIKDEIYLTWRREEKDHTLQEFNARMAQAQGYGKTMVAGIQAALDKFGLTPESVARVVYSAPDFRSHGQVTKRMKFDPASGQVQDALFALVGGTGTAQPLMMLAGALESGLEPGDHVLLAHYGDGVDVMVFKVTEALGELPSRRGIQGHMASQQPLESFARFLRYKGIARMGDTQPAGSPVQIWREQRQLFALYGCKCNQCGMVRYPINRVCSRCRSKDDYTEVRMAQKGTLFNFIHDRLYDSVEMPTTLCIVDLEGGGRIFTQMTDREVDEVELDMDVELTLRIVQEGKDFYSYFWKCRPVR